MCHEEGCLVREELALFISKRNILISIFTDDGFFLRGVF